VRSQQQLLPWRGDQQLQTTDAELIRDSITQPECFAVLFRRYAPQLQRYAVRRLGPALADDVVAETFLYAFRQRERYRVDESPSARAWLYGIATNLIGRQRRAEVRQYRALARTGIDTELWEFTDEVDERVSAGALERVLAGSLAGLPSKQREALLLVAWAGLSYEETARALQIPVGTVRSRISRARAQLRRELERTPDSESGSQSRHEAGDAVRPER
jgi:RNA polymerase sigma factor (sigma-70 family)